MHRRRCALPSFPSPLPPLSSVLTSTKLLPSVWLPSSLFARALGPEVLEAVGIETVDSFQVKGQGGGQGAAPLAFP